MEFKDHEALRALYQRERSAQNRIAFLNRIYDRFSRVRREYERRRMAEGKAPWDERQ